VSVRRAHVIAAELASANAGTGMEGPAPIPIGVEPNDRDALIGRYRAWSSQPFSGTRYYGLNRGPCGRLRHDRYHDDPVAPRLGPLLRALERRVSEAEGKLVALCLDRMCEDLGPRLFDVEVRTAARGGTWMNPRRGVDTVILKPYSGEEIAMLHQGAIDALPLFLLVSRGCRYDLMASLTGCSPFAITQEAAYIPLSPERPSTRRRSPLPSGTPAFPATARHRR
jgi:hypothetical protein